MRSIREDVLTKTYGELSETVSYIDDFFKMNALPFPPDSSSIPDFIKTLPYVLLEDIGVSKERLLSALDSFIDTMERVIHSANISIDSVTISAGFDKDGKPESTSGKFQDSCRIKI